MRGCSYESKIANIEKIARLTGSPIICVKWRDTSKVVKSQPTLFDYKLSNPLYNPNEGYIDLDTLTYDNYDVRLDNTLNIQALVYPITQEEFTGFGKNGEIDPRNKATIIYWDNEDHKRVLSKAQHDTTGEGEMNVPNPYRVIPAMCFHREQPNRYFFLPVNEPLIYANFAINLQSVIGNFIGRYQTHAQPVRPDGIPNAVVQKDMSGQSPVDELGTRNMEFNSPHIPQWKRFREHDLSKREAGATILGPNNIVYGEFEYANPNPNLDKLKDWIESELRWIAAAHNLNPDRYVKQFVNGISGESYRMADIKAEMAAKQDRPLFANHEKRLFELIKVIWNTHAAPGDKLDEDCELDITFRDPEVPMELTEKWNYLMAQYKEGFTGPIDVIRSLNTHLTEAEAIQEWERIQGQIEKYKPQPQTQVVVPSPRQTNQGEVPLDIGSTKGAKNA